MSDFDYTWYFIDEEEQFEKLIEACNIKGIRERRLQENLRKLRDRLKLKKTRKPKPIATAGVETPVEERKEESESEEESSQEEDKHVLFCNDNYQQAMINAVWFGKKMPSKRQALNETRQVATRRAQAPQAKKSLEDTKPTLESLRETLLNIESAYTDSGLALQREYDNKAARDLIREKLAQAKSASEFGPILLKLEHGFSTPHIVRYKNSKEEFEEIEEDEEDEQDEDEDEEESVEEEEEESKEVEPMEVDSNVRIIPLKFFKYWSSRELRSSWREYVFSELEGCENFAALSVAVRILERVNNEFL